MSLLPQPLRDALRALGRAPFFSFVTVLVLTSGLGASLLLFNAVQALLWRPLAFPHPDQLMFVHLQGKNTGGWSATGRDCAVIHDNVKEVAEVGMTAARPILDLALGDQTLSLEASEVNSGYLRALELQPLLGNLFRAEEDQGDPSELAAVLTEAAWRSRFGSDPAVVGRVFPGLTRTTRSRVRILGVLREGSTLPLVSDAEILIALPWMSPQIRADGASFYRTLVRLKPGVGREAASARIDSLFKALGNLGPEFPLNRSYRLDPLRQVLAPAPSSVLFLLYGAAGLLLLLTCANAASLFLARTLGRLHDMAIRHALGASLGRAFLAPFLESLLVCGGSLVLALLMNHLASPLVLHLLPELKQVGPELLRPGWALMGFGTLLCLGVSLVLALLASTQVREARLREALGEGGHQATRARHPLRAALVSVQVAVILVLLTAGGLVVRSFQKALSLDSGFQAKGAVCFEVDLPSGPEAWTASGCELASLATSVPGTRRATFSKGDPVGRRFRWHCSVGNHPGPLGPEDPNVDFLGIGPSYFETLGARLLEGRTFTEGEVMDDASVVILNASASRLLFPGQDPLGRTLHLGMGDRLSRIVGVVQDLRNHALDEPSAPEFYIPYFQKFGSRLVMTVRTGLAPGNFERAFRARMNAWNGGARMRRFSPVAALAETTLQERFRAGVLVGGIAVLGLLIGSAGLYGTLSTQVTQGLREMGLRMALGAQRGEILQLVLRRGARQVSLGLAMGLAGSLLAAHAMERMLFGVGPMDPIAFATATLVMGFASFIASLIPALRAAALDPAQILRMNQG